METPIYAVYVYSHEWTIDELGYLDWGDKEFVGFYYEKETAIRAVEENWCDIQDHYARAALVKEIEPGLYPMSHRNRCWYYIWNSNKECFESAKIPEVEWWPEE